MYEDLANITRPARGLVQGCRRPNLPWRGEKEGDWVFYVFLGKLYCKTTIVFLVNKSGSSLIVLMMLSLLEGASAGCTFELKFLTFVSFMYSCFFL